MRTRPFLPINLTPKLLVRVMTVIIDENRGGRIVSLGVTAMTSVVSTISRRVSLVATRISRGKHQMPPFPTTAVPMARETSALLR
eukprot:scaffold5202_cov157-Cylindrotheca_fusiformis.AAC.2